jgi:hypothetical protein
LADREDEREALGVSEELDVGEEEEEERAVPELTADMVRGSAYGVGGAESDLELELEGASETERERLGVSERESVGVEEALIDALGDRLELFNAEPVMELDGRGVRE